MLYLSWEELGFRSCGKVFCADCSENTVALPEEQLYEPVRVCAKCFNGPTPPPPHPQAGSCKQAPTLLSRAQQCSSSISLIQKFFYIKLELNFITQHFVYPKVLLFQLVVILKFVISTLLFSLKVVFEFPPANSNIYIFNLLKSKECNQNYDFATSIVFCILLLDKQSQSSIFCSLVRPSVNLVFNVYHKWIGLYKSNIQYIKEMYLEIVNLCIYIFIIISDNN